jgi:hypothetical protein
MSEPTLTPEQKVQYVERQIVLAQRGEVEMICCPYCGIACMVGAESLCCDLLGQAVHAVLFKFETTSQLQMAAQIAENVDKTSPISLAVN